MAVQISPFFNSNKSTFMSNFCRLSKWILYLLYFNMIAEPKIFRVPHHHSLQDTNVELILLIIMRHGMPNYYPASSDPIIIVERFHLNIIFPRKLIQWKTMHKNRVTLQSVRHRMPIGLWKGSGRRVRSTNINKIQHNLLLK